MATLRELGVTTKRQFLTETAALSLAGREVVGSSKKTTRLTLTLPTATPLKVAFCAESMAKKLTKIFKRELQTGDRVFDSAVYITTDTPDDTARFLVSPDVRALVAALVTTGPLQISGDTVTAEVLYHSQDEDENVTNLIAALLR